MSRNKQQVKKWSPHTSDLFGYYDFEDMGKLRFVERQELVNLVNSFSYRSKLDIWSGASVIDIKDPQRKTIGLIGKTTVKSGSQLKDVVVRIVDIPQGKKAEWKNENDLDLLQNQVFDDDGSANVKLETVSIVDAKTKQPVKIMQIFSNLPEKVLQYYRERSVIQEVDNRAASSSLRARFTHVDPIVRNEVVVNEGVNVKQDVKNRFAQREVEKKMGSLTLGETRVK